MTATLRLRLLSLGEVLAAETWNLITGLEIAVVVVVVGTAELRRRPVKGLKAMELMFKNLRVSPIARTDEKVVRSVNVFVIKGWIWLGI